MNTVAFDLSTDTIRVVSLKRTPKAISIVRAASVKMEIGPDTEKEEKLRLEQQALAELVSTSKSHSRQARLVLRRNSVYLRHLKLPRVPEDELKKAIHWQADKILPFPASEAIMDFQVLDKGELNRPDEIEIILVALPQPVIQDAINLFAEQKINLEIIDVPAFSIIKAYHRNYATDEGATLMLDVSVDLLSIAVVNESLLQFSRQMHVREFDLDYLVGQINSGLLYYQFEFPRTAITRVILSGDAEIVKGLADGLGHKLEIRTEIADPLRNIHLEPGKFFNVDELKSQASGYMGAIGLAL